MIALFNKDCFEGMKTEVEPHSVNLVLTDPPFNCTDAHWEKKLDLELFKKTLRTCCDKKALFVCFSLQPFTSYVITTFKQCFKYMLYWDKHRKTGYMNAPKVPLRVIEEIIVMKLFPKEYGQVYNPQMVKREKPIWVKSAPTPLYKPKEGFIYGRKHLAPYAYPTNLISQVLNQKEQFHPTQKPSELVEWLVKTYSNEGDLILDPFSGSATTAIACIRTNRNFIGFELDPIYFEKAVVRIENEKKIKAIGGEKIEKIPILIPPQPKIKPKKEKQLYLF